MAPGFDGSKVNLPQATKLTRRLGPEPIDPPDPLVRGAQGTTRVRGALVVFAQEATEIWEAAAEGRTSDRVRLGQGAGGAVCSAGSQPAESADGPDSGTSNTRVGWPERARRSQASPNQWVSEPAEPGAHSAIRSVGQRARDRSRARGQRVRTTDSEARGRSRSEHPNPEAEFVRPTLGIDSRKTPVTPRRAEGPMTAHGLDVRPVNGRRGPRHALQPSSPSIRPSTMRTFRRARRANA